MIKKPVPLAFSGHIPTTPDPTSWNRWVEEITDAVFELQKKRALWEGDNDEYNELVKEDRDGGECKKFSAGDVPNYSSPSSPAPSSSNPPQQEEFRGESKCPYLNDDCPRCYPNPQLKEESPKEDEWIDDLYENFSSHWDKNGRSLETFIRNLLTLAQQRTEKKWRKAVEKAKEEGAMSVHQEIGDLIRKQIMPPVKVSDLLK